MTLLAPEKTTTTDTGEKDPAHYFRKTDLDRALFEAVTIRALCGKRARPIRGIEGRPVCPECDAIYNDDGRLLNNDV